MRVEVVHFEGCPHADPTFDRLVEATSGRSDVEVVETLVDHPDQAERHQMHGSPTILIDGRDPFAAIDAPAVWGCRIYETETGPAGVPSVAMLRRALSGSSDGLRPRGSRSATGTSEGAQEGSDP